MPIEPIAGVGDPGLVLPVYKPAGSVDPSLATGTALAGRFDQRAVVVPAPPVPEPPAPQQAAPAATAGHPAGPVQAAGPPGAQPHGLRPEGPVTHGPVVHGAGAHGSGAHGSGAHGAVAHGPDLPAGPLRAAYAGPAPAARRVDTTA